ncbi:MAG: sigma-54 dependent transcriptional regulator [Gammaproteobacteria bacterium]|nr:sigma-54 dependent transcriptional regulator [Gammaproteobacteria bacterium]
MHSILVIEDEAVIRSSLKQFLEKQGYAVSEAGSIEEALRQNLQDFSLIITDVRLPGTPGTDVIPIAGHVPVLVMTSYASMRSAIDTMKLGAADYIAKPFDYDEILRTVKALIRPEIRNTAAAMINGMIGACDSMRTLFTQISKIAPTTANVLIEGESGTGKGSVARALHQLSQQADRELIAINCASTPDEVLERELFGDALDSDGNSKISLIEAADNSTLYLDEVAELSLPCQARLLTVLQKGVLKRTRTSTKRKVNIRLVTSSSRDLRKLVSLGRFREDLYYLLNVVKITLPPLRDRKDDLKALASSFLEHLGKKFHKPGLRFAEDTMTLLMTYHWPGNVKELQNTIEGAVILCDGQDIRPQHLSVDVREPVVGAPPSDMTTDMSLEEYFLRFVQDNQAHMTETQLASALGISRKSLWEKRQKLNIPRTRSRQKQ